MEEVKTSSFVCHQATYSLTELYVEWGDSNFPSVLKAFCNHPAFPAPLSFPFPAPYLLWAILEREKAPTLKPAPCSKLNHLCSAFTLHNSHTLVWNAMSTDKGGETICEMPQCCYTKIRNLGTLFGQSNLIMTFQVSPEQ